MRKTLQLVAILMIMATGSFAQTQYTICKGESVRLQTTSADLYEWLPHDGLDNPYSQSPLATPSVTTTYRVRRLRTSGDLITNGNFSAGNTGFTSNYRDSTDIIREGFYRVTNIARNAQSSFNLCTDHTSGTGNMMVSNGAPIANQVVWSQVITVQPNTNYAFSTWVNVGVSTGAKSILQFSINSNLLGTQFTTQYSPCEWQRFYATWNSGTATQAVISIVNQNTVLEGNDFALDDIFFESFTIDSTLATVNVNPALPAPFVTIAGDITPCRGETVSMAGPANALAYLWSDGLVQQSRTVDSGAFSLRVLGPNNCYSFASDTISVKPQPYPGAPIASTTLTSGALCAGDSARLIVTDRGGTDPGLTFRWSNGNVGDTITIYGGGTYTAKAISNQGCESQNSNAVNIGSRSRPQQPRITFLGDTTFCQGDSVRLTSSYTQNNTWNTGEVSRAVTVQTTGLYSVVFRAPAGCASLPRTVQVTVSGAGVRPQVTASGMTTLCSGDSITLTSNLPNGNVWSTGARTQSIRVGQSGNYSVTSTTTCGTSTSLPINITVNTRPGIPIVTVSGNINFCEGDSVRLVSNAPTGNLWSTGATSQSITLRQAASITIQAIASGCTSAVSQPIVVRVNARPGQPSIQAAGPITFCQGGLVQLAATGTGARGTWSTGAISQTIEVRSSGSYTFTSISAQGCSSQVSAPVQVMVNPLPSTPVIELRGVDTLATQASASRYEWYFNSLVISTNARFAPIQDGLYTVIVYSPQNCASAVSQSFNFRRVSVKDALEYGVALYPNPSAGTLQVSGLKNGIFSLYNTIGQLVFTKSVSANELIDISNLANGIYKVKIQSGRTTYASNIVLTR